MSLIKTGCRRGDSVRAGSSERGCGRRRARGARQRSAGGGQWAHRRQDGQRAAAGARAQRLGADARPPAEATLGPALLAQTPRGARRRCQTRHHIPKGPRYPQQAHAREVPKAER